MQSRDEAWALMTEYTAGESLRKHMLAVEAAVRGYARLWGENEQEWGLVALLHDFDYERWPDQANHPFRGVEILKEKGYPEWVTRAILSHAEYSGVPRESRLEHTLFACDEMSGIRDRRGARQAVEEHPRPRGEFSHQTDEGQGLRPGRQPRRLAARCRRDWLAPRRAHYQCDRLHAGRGRRPGAPWSLIAGVATVPLAGYRTTSVPIAYKLTTWIRTCSPILPGRPS